MTYLNTNPMATLDAAITNASRGAFADLAAFKTSFQTNGNAFVGTFDFTNADTGAIGGFDVDGGAALNAEGILKGTGTSYGINVLEGFKVKFPELSERTNKRWVDLQVGANADQTLRIGITAANTSALGVSDVDVSTLPQYAIVHIDQAINAVSLARADIGAALSRLSYSESNLSSMNENIQSSRSRMLDTDFAEETARLTRDQILQQSGLAMLAMANNSPKQVLSLLKNL